MLDAEASPCLAPEQRTGEPATTQTNFYSLGVIIYEALTGAAPGECGRADHTKDMRENYHKTTSLNRLSTFITIFAKWGRGCKKEVFKPPGFIPIKSSVNCLTTEEAWMNTDVHGLMRWTGGRRSCVVDWYSCCC